MTCDESIPLIAGATEGRVAPSELNVLVEHLEQCERCAHEAETQLIVKRLLESRPNERVPEGLAQRLTARLDAEPPLAIERPMDWRKWAIRLLPAAAALALAAGIAIRLQRHPTSTDLPSAVASWGRGEVGTLESPSSSNLSDQQLLGALLLGALPVRPLEQNKDQR